MRAAEDQRKPDIWPQKRAVGTAFLILIFVCLANNSAEHDLPFHPLLFCNFLFGNGIGDWSLHFLHAGSQVCPLPLNAVCQEINIITTLTLLAK